MATTPEDRKNLLRIDAIDIALLFAAGVIFGLVVTSLNLVSANAPSSHLVSIFAPLILVPLIARRLLFGMPARGRMKAGLVWSLSGVFGLLSLIFGLAMLSIGLWGILGALTPEPDSSAEVASEMASMPRLPTFGIPVPGESHAAFMSRLADENARRQESNRRSFTESIHNSWVANHAHRVSTSERLLAIGFIFAVFGTLLDRARFDRKALAATTALAV